MANKELPSLLINVQEIERLFGSLFSSLNFRHSTSVIYHSLLIIRHLKYPTHLTLLLTCHHLIFFTLFVSPKLDTQCSIFFFSVSPNPVKEEREKKEKETQIRSLNPVKEEEEKKEDH